MSDKQCNQWVELISVDRCDRSFWSVRCILNEGHDGIHESMVRWYKGASLPDLVSTQEVAQRLRVKKETVHAWRYRGILPKPDFDLAVGPVWLWSTIEEWAKITGRL